MSYRIHIPTPIFEGTTATLTLVDGCAVVTLRGRLRGELLFEVEGFEDGIVFNAMLDHSPELVPVLPLLLWALEEWVEGGAQAVA
jgi:hypothetical protein